MKYKKLSNHFWKVEINGNIIVGNWENINKGIQEMMKNGDN